MPKTVDDAPAPAAPEPAAPPPAPPPPAPEPEPEPDPEAEPEPVAEDVDQDDTAEFGDDSHLKPQLEGGDDVDDDFEVPSIDDVTVEAKSNLASPKGRAKRRLNVGALIGWSSLVAFLGVVIGGGWFMRDTVMEIWPPSTKLYELAGLTPGRLYALALNEVTSSQVIEGDVTVIVITGEIINITEELQAVPRMRGAILDGEAVEIFTWTFDPPAVEISAGETIEFNTRVPNPPEGARGILVTFIGDD